MVQLNISVGHAEIDTIHRELAELTERLAVAPDAEFVPQYEQLIEHTRQHFEHEEKMMSECGFVHAKEHVGEHLQMLNEMKQFGKRPRPMTRAYVRDRLPERFALHINRMDSLLAAFINKV